MKGNSTRDFLSKKHHEAIDMNKPFIKHENLRKALEDFEIFDDLEHGNVSFERVENELRHSCLIIAADITEDGLSYRVFEDGDGQYGLLFTDMDEFRKTFSDDDCESHSFDLWMYRMMIELEFLDGFILNPESEAVILKGELLMDLDDLPKHDYDQKESLEGSGLKRLRDSIDNGKLERFITDPSNVARYEELIGCMSDSTMLTMLLCDENLDGFADGGVIDLNKTGPVTRLYVDRLGGSYATIYTSEDKMVNVDGGQNRYSQIVNVSMMADYILMEDMDGIIINPGCDDVLLTREVILEYWPLLRDTCNDSRLNGAIFHMFPMES